MTCFKMLKLQYFTALQVSRYMLGLC